MKRLLACLLTLALLASLAACGKGGLSLDPGDNNSGGLITPDEDGVAMGYEGDTLRTEFFDMTIENPQTYEEYDGLIPTEGYQFLAMDLTLYNYTNFSCPMYDTDFEVVWDLEDDDAWAWPECDESLDDDGNPLFSPRSDKQIPTEFNLGIHKTQTGVLLYQVPADSTDFIVAFYEVFEPQEGSTEPDYGSAYYVLFSA